MQPNSLAAQEIIDLLIASMSPETKRRAIIDLAKYNSVNLDHEKYDALALKQNGVINTVDEFFSYIVNFSKDEGVAVNNNYIDTRSICSIIFIEFCIFMQFTIQFNIERRKCQTKQTLLKEVKNNAWCRFTSSTVKKYAT